MKQIHGAITGLKTSQIRRLENFYHRRVRPEQAISPELAKDVCLLSHEMGRQIGLLINRAGRIEAVIAGDAQRIVIPDLGDYRLASYRLKGVRCVHTHLGHEALTRDDLADLALLRLDLMAAVCVGDDGLPERIHMAHILPGAKSEAPYRILPPVEPHQADIGCLELIQALENELAQAGLRRKAKDGEERALLVSVTNAPRARAMEELAELNELAISAGIHVIDSVLQLRKQIDPRYLIGLGKLKELTVHALHQEVTILIFDQELSPSQIRSITDHIQLKVIDRTQLILDIFAQRARTREGKLQVELAQLNYLLPRLVTKNTALSRLTGGIGGRGPGETKLEINRRRVRDRIRGLENELDNVVKQRRQRKARRSKRGLPVISIIGYTNAGKSTLLNTLTRSSVAAESRMFATLDPSSRRLRFPRDIEVIITDTVGFIRDLPKELMAAFRATLEELENADLLLHVADIANPRFEDQIGSVNRILMDLDLHDIPMLYVLNKQDLAEPEIVSAMARKYGGIAVSAIDKTTLMPLFDRMAALIESLAAATNTTPLEKSE